MKYILLIVFLVLIKITLFAQANNVIAKLNNAQDKFTITYDLAVQEQKYWDVRLVAFIDGIRIDPSRMALEGDIGLNIKSGKRKHIVWEAYLDVESIDGSVRFEVWASPSSMKPLPAPNIDYIASGTAVAAGGTLIANALPNLFKKGKTDATISAVEDPILYYQTFCDAQSVNFDANLVLPRNNGQISLCDQHFMDAQQKYQTATTQTILGGSLVVLGSALLLIKPFHQYFQMPKYLKENGLAIRPVLQLNVDQNANFSQASVACKLSYRF